MTPGVRHKGIFTRTAAHYMALSSTCPKLSESCGRSELEDPGVDLALNPTASEPSSEPELVRTGYSPFRNYLLLGDPAVRLTASDVRGNVKTTGIEGAGDATVDWAGREDLNLRPCAPKAGQNLPSICPRIIKETLSIRTATLGLCFHACCAYIQAPLSDWFVSAKKPRKMVPTGWRSVCERWC